MGLDIYAGTLTRYYSHNWKTVVQQWAEENGYAFNRITPDGEPADNEGGTVRGRGPGGGGELAGSDSERHFSAGPAPYAPWPENNESPYYTDKPDWDAFGAMLLAAACHTYEEPVPPTVEKDWNFGEHPWSPALRRTRSGYGPCSVGLPGGCLCRTPSSSKHLCLPTTPPPSARWADCGRSWRS